METFAIVAMMLVGCVGLALLFVGLLASLLMALGRQQWPWAVGILVFLPIGAVYAFVNARTSSWPRSLILGGLASVAVAALWGWFFAPAVFAR